MRRGIRKYYETHEGPNAGKVFSEDVRRRVSDGVRKALADGKMIGSGEKRKGSNNGNARRVLCIDTGIEYACAKDAADETGINPHHIWANARGARKDAGGMQWKYLDPPLRSSKMTETYRANKRGIKNGRARPIMCIETGEIYGTGRELAAVLGLSKGSVSTLMGRGGTIKGLHYKFIDKGEEIYGTSVDES